ncbi:hypothetical protein ACFLUJ_08590 [Chloroflexota bacterium]
MTEVSPDSTVRSKKTDKINILLAGDRPLFRKSIRSVLDEELEFQIVGKAGNGEEAIRLVSKLQPDGGSMSKNGATID